MQYEDGKCYLFEGIPDLPKTAILQLFTYSIFDSYGVERVMYRKLTDKDAWEGVLAFVIVGHEQL